MNHAETSDRRGLAGGRTTGRCLVVGILNVTADSFSDGGRYLDLEAALAHGRSLTADGADLVDVGGESTRPGAQRVSASEESARVVPVVRALAGSGVRVSVDTMRASVAEAAVAAGAVVVNDVSGGLADPDMLRTVANLDTDYVAMHWRGHSDRMSELAQYGDVVADVVRELADRLEAATRAGIGPSRIVLDPGVGFAKEAAHNWSLLANLDAFAVLGRPLLVGVSRKRFLGELLRTDVPHHGGVAPEPGDRDLVTSVLSGLCAREGVRAVRVHDVRGTREAIAVAEALRAVSLGERGVRLAPRASP